MGLLLLCTGFFSSGVCLAGHTQGNGVVFQKKKLNNKKKTLLVREVKPPPSPLLLGSAENQGWLERAQNVVARTPLRQAVGSTMARPWSDFAYLRIIQVYDIILVYIVRVLVLSINSNFFSLLLFCVFCAARTMYRRCCGVVCSRYQTTVLVVVYSIRVVVDCSLSLVLIYVGHFAAQRIHICMEQYRTAVEQMAPSKQLGIIVECSREILLPYAPRCRGWSVRLPP